MTPSMSLQLQDSLRDGIFEYAEFLSKGFIPKKNITAIIAEHIDKAKEELTSQGFKTLLAKKYSSQLVNAYAQRVMSEINK